ncbi:mono/diheme cytochrome c family protein [Prosthecobacter fusiformis]|uniref:Mono/diheme cytochrome c family protein n=1 Tax=Prosthecobacter fusiformis TaxID=48464 RepID=A0A4R7SP61_9BACT|nr:cytochrome c [Prosthecobacter fusiformis]TDU80980.1 mono/diheme cytochrome c family protein [Prosthecobacter fusiformis]
MSAPSSFPNPDSNDLDRLHAAVKREKADLEPGREPAPMWVLFLFMIIAIIAGGQLGPMAGGFSFDVSNPFAASNFGDPRGSNKDPGAGADPFQVAMKKGASGYAVCGGCHQGSGLGLAGQYPPLAGSEWVLGGTERLIRVVQHGLVGQVTVKGQNYNFPGGMQGFGAAMSAGDLANVLTYIRNNWGNEGTMITKEMVEKVRAEEKRATQWTMADLEAFKDKNVPGDIPAGPGATAAAPAP